MSLQSFSTDEFYDVIFKHKIPSALDTDEIIYIQWMSSTARDVFLGALNEWMRSGPTAPPKDCSEIKLVPMLKKGKIQNDLHSLQMCFLNL